MLNIETKSPHALGLMRLVLDEWGNSKITSELLAPLDLWGVPWDSCGDDHIQSELLKPLDQWVAPWTNNGAIQI